MTERPKAMPIVVPKYRGKHSRYPDQVRVSFLDGNTHVYELRVEQPAPMITERIEIIMPVVGYPNTRRRRWRR